MDYIQFYNYADGFYLLTGTSSPYSCHNPYTEANLGDKWPIAKSNQIPT